MGQGQTFQRGDEVVHPRRPEWGRGVVRSAVVVRHEDGSQRLEVQFANAGRKTVNTAVAPLLPAGAATSTSAASAGASEPIQKGTSMALTATRGKEKDKQSGPGWLDKLEHSVGGQKHELWDLPDAMINPFSSVSQRLRATLDGYRFSTEPRALIEWGVVQTGLDDPMTRYTRVEMEQAFARFARNRDAHLQELVRELKRKGDQATLRQAQQQAGRNPRAQAALQRAIRG